MNFFDYSFPVGRFRGVLVRIHFTFLIYFYFRLVGHSNVIYDALVLLGLFFCILLHEFGHIFAARFCGGDADEVIIWPFGGLALVRPIFNPTAELITTAAGPFVTLVLWGVFEGAIRVMLWLNVGGTDLFYFLLDMAFLNKWLLVFNLIPAFPMDGGRMLMELLWYRIGFECPTKRK